MPNDNWIRCSKRHMCPICGKPDWCMLAVDGCVVICSREPSEKHLGEAGWLHRIKESEGGPKNFPAKKLPSGPKPEMVNCYVRDWNKDPIRLLSRKLGVSELSLNRLGIGVNRTEEYTFPMKDGNCRTIGFRIRNYRGQKWSVKGSSSGLFIPDTFHGDDTMYIVEGPTDTAAMLDLGLDCIGRPSCSGGKDYIVQFLSRHKVSVVILADRDVTDVAKRNTRMGALLLAKSIKHLCTGIKMIHPPFGKDPREWVNDGATRAMVESVVKSTKYWTDKGTA